MRFCEIFAGCPAYPSAIKPTENPGQDYIIYVSMAVADFTQFEIFANMIEAGAMLCITANFAAQISLPMFAWGRKRPISDDRAMSAFPPKATKSRCRTMTLRVNSGLMHRNKISGAPSAMLSTIKLAAGEIRDADNHSEAQFGLRRATGSRDSLPGIDRQVRL
jgi:hypothetical protein